MGWRLLKADIPGHDAMGLLGEGDRFMIVQKAPGPDVVKEPAISFQQELEDLLRSLQL